MKARPCRAVIERAAITHYGEPKQAVKCMEECAELIEALGVTLNTPDVIVKYAQEIKRLCKACLSSGQPVVMIVSNEQREHIIEETADVTLTTDQNKMIFGSTLIMENAKLTRLAENMGMEVTKRKIKHKKKHKESQMNGMIIFERSMEIKPPF